MPSSVVDMLANVPLFSACTKAELKTVASFGTEIQVPAGKKLAIEGRPGSEFFLIIEGRARADVGGEKILDLGPGDFFGEMALIDRGRRHATVTALTIMKLLVLSSNEFFSMLETAPSITKKLLFAFASRQRQINAVSH